MSRATPEYLYHGTSRTNWEAIQRTGALEPRDPADPFTANNRNDYTTGKLIYMAYEPGRAASYGEVVLKIRTKTLTNLGWTGGHDSYIATTNPIPITEIEELNRGTA